MSGRKRVDAKQVCELLGISKSTLPRGVKAGIIFYVETSQEHRFVEEAMEDLLKEKSIKVLTFGTLVDEPHDHQWAPRHGGCPEAGCGNVDRCLNVGARHYLVCDEPKTYWRIGTNLFSWHEDSDEEWERNAALLGDYWAVEGVSVCTVCGNRGAGEVCDLAVKPEDWAKRNRHLGKPDEDDWLPL